MTKLAFVSTRTLGPDADIHAVWEVGVVAPNDDGELEEKRWLLRVDGAAFADPAYLESSGFNARHPQGPGLQGSKIANQFNLFELEVFAKDFNKTVWGCHLVSFEASFDEERLRKIVRSQALGTAWKSRPIDLTVLGALNLSRSSGEDITSYSPYSLVDQIDLDMPLEEVFETMKTSLGTAQIAQKVYELLT